jgi:hypothetical protein
MQDVQSEWDDFATLDLHLRARDWLGLREVPLPRTSLQTVGDFADHLCTLVPVRPEEPCESFEQFERVREALEAVAGIPAASLRPDTPLDDLLRTRGILTWKRLSKRLGVGFPFDLSVDGFGLLLITLIPLNAIGFLLIDWPDAAMLGLPLAVVQSLLLVRVMRRVRSVRPPGHLRTLADLTCLVMVAGRRRTAIPTVGEVRLLARYLVGEATGHSVRSIHMRTRLEQVAPLE